MIEKLFRDTGRLGLAIVWRRLKGRPQRISQSWTTT